MASLSDRYEVLGLLATGGMASVLYGRLKGPTGFAREVAIKRLHPHFAREPEFLAMFVDEAHICSRLSHANIVSVLDVIETPPDLCLVMEYVHGAALDALLQAARARSLAVPVPIAIALLSGVLHGLHAAHEARDESGAPLGIVHRYVSPSNVLVGQDGVPRVLDFGIACAFSKVRSTPTGELKGKFAYMAPELLRGLAVDKRYDVYAAAVVLWETLAGRSLFGRQPSASVVQDVLEGVVPAPGQARADISPTLDAIVRRGLARDPAERFESAEAFAIALEQQCEVATQSDVSAWVRALVGNSLDDRAMELRRLAQERTARKHGGVDLPLSEETLKRPYVPTLVRDEQTAEDTRVSETPAPPAWTAQSRRWLTRAAAVLMLGGVLQADAKYRSTPEASPAEPDVAKWSAPEPSPPVVVPHVQQLAVTHETHSDTVATQSDVRASYPRDARRQPRKSKLPEAFAMEPQRRQAGAASPPVVPPSTSKRASEVSKGVVRGTSEASSSAAADCKQAFELQTIDGLVVKTFKPNCLR